MIPFRCFCGAKKEFPTMRAAEDAGWWANPAPREEPSDLCPTHNIPEFRVDEQETSLDEAFGLAGHGECCGHGPYKD